MAYSTYEQIEERCGEAELTQLTDALGTGLPHKDTVALFIAKADNFVNAFVEQGGYTPPLDPAPALLAYHTVSVVRHMLFRFGRPDYVEKDYDKAVAYLEKLANGRVKVTTQAPDEPTARATVKARTQVFSDTLWETH